MSSDETMEPHLAGAVTEMVAQMHAAAGDYSIVVDANVDSIGHTVYTWRWFWAPKAIVHEGSIG